MSQNIYDDPDFFAGYSALPRSLHGLDGAPEWPALRAMLPDLTGLRALDLGCGFGWFCRWARAHGAASVLGLDLSEKMLARAQAETNDAAIRYARADLEQADLAAGAFDLAYSSLAFHYVADFAGLVRKIHAALAPSGKLVFSIEHPICTAPRQPGWAEDADGRRIWPLDSYLDEGRRVTNWLADGVVKQHRTIASTVNALLGAGFGLTHFDEWSASPAQIEAHPDWAGERERPYFLLIGCERR
jgi:SAM-dependent methyltransferase